MSDSPQVTHHKPLRLLSVIIPARDEEGCVASTVEHLHLELDLRGVPHEIMVVDNNSTARAWRILQKECQCLNAYASVTMPDWLAIKKRPLLQSANYSRNQ